MVRLKEASAVAADGEIQEPIASRVRLHEGLQVVGNPTEHRPLRKRRTRDRMWGAPGPPLGGAVMGLAAQPRIWGRPRAARARRPLFRGSSREHPCTPPPCRGVHDPFEAASGAWLPGVENSRLLAQRGHSARCAPFYQTRGDDPCNVVLLRRHPCHRVMHHPLRGRSCARTMWQSAMAMPTATPLYEMMECIPFHDTVRSMTQSDMTRLATGVHQVRRDQQELDPTASADMGCGWFLLSSGGDQSRYY